MTEQGILDSENKLTEGYSVSLDVAVLHSDNLYAPKEMSAHIIDLDSHYMDVKEFVNTFYFYNSHIFQINTLLKNKKISFQHQTLNNKRFLLIETILQLYQQDLEKCIDPSSRIILIKQLSKYKHLNDLCLHECSLSFSDIIHRIIDKNCKSFEEIFGSSDNHVYHHFIINTRFTNSNVKQFKDIIIKFNFIVCFKGEGYIEDSIYPEYLDNIEFGSGSGFCS